MREKMPEIVETEAAALDAAADVANDTPKPETNHQDLAHFLKLAAAQVRNRMKQVEASPSKSQQTEVRESKLRMLALLEDLIKEQGQTNENSRHSASPTR